MSDDPTKLPPQDDQPRDKASSEPPAQWARGQEGTVSGTQASDEGRAAFLDDEQMSLASKLRGGGRDLVSEDEKNVTKLCPACSTVSNFIDGKCTNCDFKLGSGGLDDVQDIRNAAIGTGEDPATKTMLIVALAVVVVIILVVLIPKLFGNTPKTNEVVNSGRPGMQTPQTGQTYAGGLSEVKVDDGFRERIVIAIEKGNAGWESEGLDAYVYRYSLGNNVVAATSQTITIQMFVGGGDAKTAHTAPGDNVFKLGLEDFVTVINAQPGVSLTTRLVHTAGNEPPDKYDRYVRYGYYYGLEHMNEIQPIIDGLEEYKKKHGQYPHILHANLIPGGIRTKQGYYFLSHGFGYLPLFTTDADGNIQMGSGSALDSMNPAECNGYYLVMYGKNNSLGLDLHSKDNEHYYQRKISPFPYDAKGGVKNLILTPDGEPDGITCVIKDGVLLDQ